LLTSESLRDDTINTETSRLFYILIKNIGKQIEKQQVWLKILTSSKNGVIGDHRLKTVKIVAFV
jgi:hypothetical protein